jgi:hypothetical protein
MVTPKPAVDVDTADGAPALVSKDELARRRARRGDSIVEAEQPHHPHSIGSNLEPAADGGRLGIGFEDQRLDAASLQKQRNRRTRDPATDDERSCCVLHAPHDTAGADICTSYSS